MLFIAFLYLWNLIVKKNNEKFKTGLITSIIILLSVDLNGHGFQKWNLLWGRWTKLLAVSPVYLVIQFGRLQNFRLQVRKHCKVWKIHLDSRQLLGSNYSCNPHFLRFLLSKLLSKPKQIFCYDMLQQNSNYEFHQIYYLSLTYGWVLWNLPLCEIFIIALRKK